MQQQNVKSGKIFIFLFFFNLYSRSASSEWCIAIDRTLHIDYFVVVFKVAPRHDAKRHYFIENDTPTTNPGNLE